MSVTGARPSLLARLKRAVDACGDVIFITDAQGLITFVNPQFTAVYGYTPDEVVGRVTPRVLKSGIHSREHYVRFWENLCNGRPVPVRMVNRARDGRLVEIEGSANPIRENGTITGFVAVQHDVTPQRDLQQRSRLAEFASDQAADGIFWVGQDGRIRYANEAAAHMLGCSRDDACALAIPDISPQFTPERFAAHFREHFPAGRTRVETTLRRQDGTEFPVEVAISYREINGQRTSCAVVRDLTDRRRLEAELQQAQKMEVVGRLTGGIAHDFNNLLTAIIGYSELALLQVQDNPALSADIEEIRTASERAGRLTRQLLGFSRKHVLNPQVLDLRQVIAEFRPMAARLIGDDVRLEIVTGDPLDRVRLDQGQVEQVLMNLLVNARDAMPKGGRATIGAANFDVDQAFAVRHGGMTPGRHVALSVADTGTGMTPEVLARACEPLFTTKPQGKGTGLGLSIVFDMVRENGGFLAIDSAVGTGTRVTAYFPGTDASRDAGASSPVSSDVAAGTETVLLVEDDAAIRALAHRVLSAHGYTVLVARDGSEAIQLEAGHGGALHLLLTDVLMPRLNGPDVAQRLVRRRPEMKVLYVSGFGHQMAVASRLVRRQTAFLQKPFAPDTLLLTVRELLDRHAPIAEPAPVPR